MQTRDVHRPFAAVALSCAVLFGACGDDAPSADDLRSEAQEQTERAAEDAKDTAETIKEAGEDVAQDVADGRDQADAGRSIEIVAPSDGATLTGGDVDLTVKVAGITIVAANGDTSGESGHFHVFIDQDPVAVGEVVPTGPGVVHSAANPIPVKGLSRGTHRLVVVVGDGTHRRLDFPTAEVRITVS